MRVGKSEVGEQTAWWEGGGSARLTYTEGVVPPVGVAEVGLEIVCSATYDDMGRCHEGADHEEHGEDCNYDP